MNACMCVHVCVCVLVTFLYSMCADLQDSRNSITFLCVHVIQQAMRYCVIQSSVISFPDHAVKNSLANQVQVLEPTCTTRMIDEIVPYSSKICIYLGVPMVFEWVCHKMFVFRGNYTSLKSAR